MRSTPQGRLVLPNSSFIFALVSVTLCMHSTNADSLVQVSLPLVIAAQLDLWATYGAQKRTVDPRLSMYDAVFVSDQPYQSFKRAKDLQQKWNFCFILLFGEAHGLASAAMFYLYRQSGRNTGHSLLTKNALESNSSKKALIAPWMLNVFFLAGHLVLSELATPRIRCKLTQYLDTPALVVFLMCKSAWPRPTEAHDSLQQASTLTAAGRKSKYSEAASQSRPRRGMASHPSKYNLCVLKLLSIKSLSDNNSVMACAVLQDYAKDDTIFGLVASRLQRRAGCSAVHHCDIRMLSLTVLQCTLTLIPTSR